MSTLRLVSDLNDPPVGTETTDLMQVQKIWGPRTMEDGHLQYIVQAVRVSDLTGNAIYASTTCQFRAAWCEGRMVGQRAYEPVMLHWRQEVKGQRLIDCWRPEAVA